LRRLLAAGQDKLAAGPELHIHGSSPSVLVRKVRAMSSHVAVAV